MKIGLHEPKFPFIVDEYAVYITLFSVHTVVLYKDIIM